MDFIDDDCSANEVNEVLVPSSQQSTSSDIVRPAKRRKLSASSSASNSEGFSESSDYDLPSNVTNEDDQFDNPKSKYESRLHVPAYAESQENEFVTQVDQPWSSPTAIRGPRWQKKGVTQPFERSGSDEHSSRPIAMPFGKSVARLPTPPEPIVIAEFEGDDDADLLEALIASEQEKASLSAQRNTPKSRQPLKNLKQTTLFGTAPSQNITTSVMQSRVHNWPVSSRDEAPTHHQIDKAAMRTWTYPLNVGTIRDYQYNIVHRALFHNILVALPTGLGKTFIAATVMLNYYNWTTNAQIVFVAPTKPLVTQQVSACFHIAGIPRSQTTLLTGEISPAIRAEEWQAKRVFFMTPQTLINDLKTGMADPKRIVLLVVDEAHKATGNYAYVEVVRFLRRFNSSFRVLALTATPGATVEAVQKVIDGLDIARVEIRTEESMDIRNFVHARNEETRIFDNSEEVDMCLDLFATAVRPVLSKVNSLNAYFSNDPKTMTLYGLMKGREQWAKSDAGRKADWGLKGMVQSCFKPLMSLAHNLELLKYHGIGPFYHKMRIFDEEVGGSGKYAKQITESESYKTLMTRLKAWVNEDGFVGHPKLTYLNEVVLNHFMDAGCGKGAAGGRPPSDTRIMVFAHYRDSAEEIVRVLNRHQPMIRAHVFVGQSGTKGSEGMDQKMQIDIIQKFKAGIYNTLVATSIGEEGLDIGEVDLIVCYDCSKSPIRMLQRMGRTGRKRAGNIVLLLMRGKEERDYHAAKDNYLKMQAIIESGKEFQFHDDASPRIVPRDIQPVVDKRQVEIPIENTQAGSPEPRKGKGKKTKRPPKKFHMPDNVNTGFQFLSARTKQKNAVTSEVDPEQAHDYLNANLPILQAVLLSEADEEDLARRYTRVAGDQPQFIRPVRLSNHLPGMLYPSSTALVKHSALTRALKKATKTMHDTKQNWDRPQQPRRNVPMTCSPCSSSENLPEQSRSRGRKQGSRSNRLGKNRATRIAVDGTQDSEHSDSGVSQSQTSDDGSSTEKLTRRSEQQTIGRQRISSHAKEKQIPPTLSSELSNTTLPYNGRDSASEEEDLPDMADLLSHKSMARAKQVTALPSSASTNNTTEKGPGNKQRARRILSDDSDD